MTTNEQSIIEYVGVIGRKIQLYFLHHNEENITPTEWKDCLVSITTNMENQILENEQLHLDIAKLQLDLINNVKSSYNNGKNEILISIINSLESFINNAPNLSQADLADIEGIKRAITIVKSEIVK